MYQGMMDGQVWRFPGTSVVDSTASPHHPRSSSQKSRCSRRVLYRASPCSRPKADPGTGHWSATSSETWCAGAPDDAPGGRDNR